jgi:hypothetical protein
VKTIFPNCALIRKTRLILRRGSGKSFHEENECTQPKVNELGRCACWGRACTAYGVRFWRQSSLTFHQSVLFGGDKYSLLNYVHYRWETFFAKINFINDDNRNRCGSHSRLNCSYKNYFSGRQSSGFLYLIPLPTH